MSDIQSSDFKNRDHTENILTCCSKHTIVDKRLIEEISKLVISFGTLTFSFVMLILNEDDNDNLYFSLISSITGYYLGKSSK